MGKITTLQQGEEKIYPITYASACFLNNGETNLLDTIGETWTTEDKNLKQCSEAINLLNKCFVNINNKIGFFGLKNSILDKISRLEEENKNLLSRIEKLEKEEK